ncbi:fumarylacetoacetate hydrolase family protein [Pseudomonas sp. BP8]|uniref:fumarylacetoacetate hydrolase family protein n=1 Tax=Pseudomonas sp. BP8 TaxID=2817864 RepID=UPI001AEA8AC9|nr:fumarylacetoacetate hydrolase family protein [Pseudomonas sp. BP8]HDS1733465.1 fumarylacetoacetate hydrolase family protein [Pseudomonas putida]
MKLATLHDHTRDGRLVVVSRDLTRAVDATAVATHLQDAIERWAEVHAPLQALYQQLNDRALPHAFDFDPKAAAAPLPRAYQWLDASAFLAHGERMQRAFGLQPIPGVETTPLMYQGASDDLLGPHQPIMLPSPEQGIDFEGEFAVLVDDVPMGCTVEKAAGHIKLLLQLNDVSLRALAPREMQTGFGFIQAKPASSFAPVAVTPDELGDAWREGRVHLRLQVQLNGQQVGCPYGGEMHFCFAQLIAHAALTRRLGAGTLLGSGTVSNTDLAAGVSCLSEQRALEMISHGQPLTPYLKFNDLVRMEARTLDDKPLFGCIEQRIVASIADHLEPDA